MKGGKEKTPQRQKRINTQTHTNMGVNSCALLGARGQVRTCAHARAASVHCPGASLGLPLCLQPLDLPAAPETGVASR